MRHLKLMKSQETSGALNILWRLGENWDYEYKMLFTASLVQVHVVTMNIWREKSLLNCPNKIMNYIHDLHQPN